MCERLVRAVASAESEVRAALRARIVLTAADGFTDGAVARELEVGVNTVRKWRGRFVAGGVEGLRDAVPSGRPKAHGRGDANRQGRAAVGEGYRRLAAGPVQVSAGQLPVQGGQGESPRGHPGGPARLAADRCDQGLPGHLELDGALDRSRRERLESAWHPPQIPATARARRMPGGTWRSSLSYGRASGQRERVGGRSVEGAAPERGTAPCHGAASQCRVTVRLVGVGRGPRPGHAGCSPNGGGVVGGSAPTRERPVRPDRLWRAGPGPGRPASHLGRRR